MTIIPIPLITGPMNHAASTRAVCRTIPTLRMQEQAWVQEQTGVQEQAWVQEQTGVQEQVGMQEQAWVQEQTGVQEQAWVCFVGDAFAPPYLVSESLVSESLVSESLAPRTLARYLESGPAGAQVGIIAPPNPSFSRSTQHAMGHGFMRQDLMGTGLMGTGSVGDAFAPPSLVSESLASRSLAPRTLARYLESGRASTTERAS